MSESRHLIVDCSEDPPVEQEVALTADEEVDRQAVAQRTAAADRAAEQIELVRSEARDRLTDLKAKGWGLLSVDEKAEAQGLMLELS